MSGRGWLCTAGGLWTGPPASRCADGERWWTRLLLCSLQCADSVDPDGAMEVQPACDLRAVGKKFDKGLYTTLVRACLLLFLRGFPFQHLAVLMRASSELFGLWTLKVCLVCHLCRKPSTRTWCKWCERGWRKRRRKRSPWTGGPLPWLAPTT